MRARRLVPRSGCARLRRKKAASGQIWPAPLVLYRFAPPPPVLGIEFTLFDIGNFGPDALGLLRTSPTDVKVNLASDSKARHTQVTRLLLVLLVRLTLAHSDHPLSHAPAGAGGGAASASRARG